MAAPGSFVAGQVLTAAELNAIGVWQDWTPVVTQPGTLNMTVVRARYVQLNDLVIAQAYLTKTATGTGTGGNAINVTVPVTGNATGGLRLGSGSFYDSSTATSYSIVAFNVNGTNFSFVGDTTTNNFFGDTPNIGMATSDQLGFTITYEAA